MSEKLPEAGTSLRATDYIDRWNEVSEGLGIDHSTAEKIANFIHCEIQTAKRAAAGATSNQQVSAGADSVSDTGKGGRMPIGREAGQLPVLQLEAPNPSNLSAAPHNGPFSVLDAIEILEYAAEGRRNSVKPDLLANEINRRIKNGRRN